MRQFPEYSGQITACGTPCEMLGNLGVRPAVFAVRAAKRTTYQPDEAD
ncbi:MAG: hypothetical protein LC114_19095 [Bryobacterales bacterium]|nr:hypothetical protein [Bryobacterales bacterium]